MKQVNAYVLRNLVWMRSFDDEQDGSLSRVDPNNEAAVKEVLEAMVKPMFLRFDANSQKIVKDTLKYYLSQTVHSPDSKIFYDLIQESTPFGFPNQIRLFFVWLWDILFGGETYLIGKEENYIVRHKAWHANQIRIAAGPKPTWPPKRGYK